MSVNQILSDIKARGIARSNRYDVIITPPQSINGADTNKLTLSCEASVVPGKGYSTANRNTYGPIQKLPYEKLYNEVEMTFRVDADMYEKKFFDAWFDAIALKNQHHFNYYESYIGTVSIIQLGSNGTPIYVATLQEAYPSMVGDLTLTQEDDNEYHKLPVTFTYKEWQPE